MRVLTSVALNTVYVLNIYMSVGGSEDSLAQIATLQNAPMAQKGKGKDKPPAKDTKAPTG